MSIQVMIKRKLIITKPKQLIPLLNQIREMAQKQPGYISGETLRSLEDPDNFLVVSKWETATDWNRWFASRERRDIQGRIDSLIGEKTFYETFETFENP